MRAKDLLRLGVIDFMWENKDAYRSILSAERVLSIKEELKDSISQSRQSTPVWTRLLGSLISHVHRSV